MTEIDKMIDDLANSLRKLATKQKIKLSKNNGKKKNWTFFFFFASLKSNLDYSICWIFLWILFSILEKRENKKCKNEKKSKIWVVLEKISIDLNSEFNSNSFQVYKISNFRNIESDFFVSIIFSIFLKKCWFSFLGFFVLGLEWKNMKHFAKINFYFLLILWRFW